MQRCTGLRQRLVIVLLVWGVPPGRLHVVVRRRRPALVQRRVVRRLPTVLRRWAARWRAVAALLRVLRRRRLVVSPPLAPRWRAVAALLRVLPRWAAIVGAPLVLHNPPPEFLDGQIFLFQLVLCCCICLFQQIVAINCSG